MRRVVNFVNRVVVINGIPPETSVQIPLLLFCKISALIRDKLPNRQKEGYICFEKLQKTKCDTPSISELSV
jgi:hypothetical protein